MAGQICLQVGVTVQTLGDKWQEPSKTDHAGGGGVYGLSSQIPGRVESSGDRGQGGLSGFSLPLSSPALPT